MSEVGEGVGNAGGRVMLRNCGICIFSMWSYYYIRRS